MDGDPTPALTGRRRTRPTSIGCPNPWQPEPGRAPLIAAHAAVQTNRATSVFMANEEHITRLKQSVDAWNTWRRETRDAHPDLTNADLCEMTLRGADLSNANLYKANLCGADLSGAFL